MRAVFDTNVLFDFLRGVPAARTEFGSYELPAISLITWMEVLVGATADTELATRAFLRRFDLVPIDDLIAGEAVRLRRSHRLRLPDAIIWATARTRSLVLVTRNTKDFPLHDPGIREP